MSLINQSEWDLFVIDVMMPRMSSYEPKQTLRMRFSMSELPVLLEVFGKYLKASFDFRNSERVVPLEQELVLVKAYLFIEPERFSDRVNVEWDIPYHLLSTPVPPPTVRPGTGHRQRPRRRRRHHVPSGQVLRGWSGSGLIGFAIRAAGRCGSPDLK